MTTTQTCEHVRTTLVRTDFTTWPATEIYKCDNCGMLIERAWEGDDDE